jgi:hypothetical protein
MLNSILKYKKKKPPAIADEAAAPPVDEVLAIADAALAIADVRPRMRLGVAAKAAGALFRKRKGVPAAAS